VAEAHRGRKKYYCLKGGKNTPLSSKRKGLDEIGNNKRNLQIRKKNLNL